jgi:hypothetical protein
MSEQQQRFDGLMKRVIKVKPEELRRRLKAAETAKDSVGTNSKRVDKGSQ